MSKKYDVENCDILNDNGHLFIVYDDGKSPYQKLLGFAKSYHTLNEQAITIFGEEVWLDYLFCMDEDFPCETITHLLADMYETHNDTYKKYKAKTCAECRDCYEDMVKDSDYLTMHVAHTDKNGHRWAVFDVESLDNLSDEMMVKLAEDMDVPNYDLKSRAELIDALSKIESDIDEDGECCDDDCCVEADEDDCGCEVECDGDCENCGFADLDDEDDFEYPDFHDTGEKTENGRSIYKYDRDELNQLTNDQMYEMACELGLDMDELHCREDLLDALCDLVCLVDEKHEDWSHRITTDEDCSIKIPEAQQGKAQQYESVDGPQHYNGTECIEEMRNLYGDDAVRWFCVCNAYKYRFRKGNKPGVDAAQDEAKARWYEKYASNMMRSAQY